MPNYWLLQNMIQSSAGMYSPNFTGVSNQSVFTNPQSTVVKKPLTRREQADLIDKKLAELESARAQFNGVIEVNTPNGVEQVTEESYDKKTGYYAADGKNDGKISFWTKLANVGKGCVNLFTDLVFDEKGELSFEKIKTTAGVGLAIGAAAYLIPGLGQVLLAASLIGGACTLVGGVVGVAGAKTDEEAEKSCQNIGSGALQTLLSILGIKSAAASAAKTAGTQAPKWYEFKKTTDLLVNQVRTEVTQAGSYANALMGRVNNAKLALSKGYYKISDYSYYNNKYNKNLEYINNELGKNPSDRTYRKILESMKKAYEGIFNASDEAALANAEANLAKTTRVLELYKAQRMPNGMQSTVDDLINISKSVAPRNARAVRLSNIVPDEFKNIMKGFNDKLKDLYKNPNRTAADNYEISVLQKLKTHYKTLYNAKTPDAQQNALTNLQNLVDDVHATLRQHSSGTTGISPQEMLKYNEIATSVNTHVASAESVINARATALINAKNTINSNIATAQEKAKAMKLLNKYENGLSSRLDDVESYIASMKNQQEYSNWFLRSKKKYLGGTLNYAKSVYGFTKNSVKQPEFLTTTNAMRIFYPSQTTFGSRFEMATGTELQQQLSAIDESINELKNMRYEIVKGKSVDVSMLQ